MKTIIHLFERLVEDQEGWLSNIELHFGINSWSAYIRLNNDITCLHTNFPSRYGKICIEKSPLLYLHQIVYCMGQNPASKLPYESKSKASENTLYKWNSTPNSTLSHAILFLTCKMTETTLVYHITSLHTESLRIQRLWQIAQKAQDISPCFTWWGLQWFPLTPQNWNWLTQRQNLI